MKRTYVSELEPECRPSLPSKMGSIRNAWHPIHVRVRIVLTLATVAVVYPMAVPATARVDDVSPPPVPPTYQVTELQPLEDDTNCEARNLSHSGTITGNSWFQSDPNTPSEPVSVSAQILSTSVLWRRSRAVPERVAISYQAYLPPKIPRKNTGRVDDSPILISIKKADTARKNKKGDPQPTLRKSSSFFLDRDTDLLVQVDTADYVKNASPPVLDESVVVYPSASVVRDAGVTGKVKAATVVGIIGSWATDRLGRARLRAFACGLDGAINYLPSPTAFSQAFAVSPSGQIVGKVATLPPGKITESSKKSLTYRACVWYPQRGKSGWQAPVLIGVPGGQSEAVAVNKIGQVVGYTHAGSGGAYFWERSGESWTETNLGTLTRASSGETGKQWRGFSCATDINDRGQIVGYVTNPSDEFDLSGTAVSHHACLWVRSSSGKYLPHDLNRLITADSGWELLRATRINNHGEIIGVGRKDGKERRFLLTPMSSPNPTAK